MLTTGKFRFGEFELDCDRRQLLRAGEPTNIYPKAFDVLQHLVENRGRALSKDELLEHVWPGQFIEENNLTVQISALRKVFGDTNGTKRFIATIPGKGYQFVADVTSADTENEFVVENRSVSRIVVEEYLTRPSNDIPSFAATQPSGENKGWTSARFAAPVSFLLLAAVLFGGYFWLRGSGAKAAVPFSQFSISRLTGNGKVDGAALSPDGKLFAYSLQNTNSLWIGHTDGGEPIEVRPAGSTRYRFLNFSPDSSKLYYNARGNEHPTGALFRISVFGGVPEKLRENVRVSVSFSPDMQRFVHVREDRSKGTSTLIISDVAATFEQELVSRPLEYGFDSTTPAWSPDGTLIAVGAKADTPYGGHSEIFAVSAATGSIHAVTNEKFREIQHIAWTKDQTGLLFIGSDSSVVDNRLRHASYPSGVVTQLNPDLSNYISTIGLSAANDKLLLVKAQYISNIWIGPADSLIDAKQITFSSIGDRIGTLGMDWMPDGKIVYASAAGNGQALWTMNADGTNRRQLTPTGSTDLNPSATGDGKTVVFSSGRSGASEVWSVNTDGGGLRQITTGGNNDMACVSPDSRWVVFVGTPDRIIPGTLSRIPLAGGEPSKLSDMPASWPQVSPDSKLVAFQGQIKGKNKLVLVSIDGGEPLKIFDLPIEANFRYGLRWTPDGQTLTYRDWKYGYWRQPIAGGEPTRIKDLPEERLFSGDWSPDGTQLAFVRGQEIRDIVLLQNIQGQ